MSRRTLRALRLAPVVLALLAACAPARREERPASASAATAAAAAAAPSGADGYSVYDLPASWRDQRGEARTLASLGGRVQVVAMVYTHCSATCPLVLAQLKRIESSIPAARRDQVGFVLVSIDPERDTPGRLAEFAASSRLDPARWTLLAGSDDAVRELAAVLGVRYQKADAGELAHANVLTVLDRTGVIAHQQLGLDGVARTQELVGQLAE